jgi:hypothetical protein
MNVGTSIQDLTGPVLAEAPTTMGLPFAHLNLRFNPFGELDLHLRADVAVVDLADWPKRLAAGRFAIQFLADCGRGKTTHLLALRRHFPDAAYVHVPEGVHRPDLPQSDPLFVDELQRVTRKLRSDLFRRGTGLAIGSHMDHRRQLERAGYEVITIRPDAYLTPHRLDSILSQRIVAARREAGPVPQIGSTKITQLLRQFGTNIRAMEYHLYDLFQTMTQVSEL